MKCKDDKLNLDHKILLAFHEVREHLSFRNISYTLSSAGVHQIISRMMTNVISKRMDVEGATSVDYQKILRVWRLSYVEWTTRTFRTSCFCQISKKVSPIDQRDYCLCKMSYCCL